MTPNKPMQTDGRFAPPLNGSTVSRTKLCVMQETPDPTAGANWPVCDHCGDRIPQLPELTESEVARIWELIHSGRSGQAVLELSSFTDWPRSLAKIWVEHRGRPRPVSPGEPCPHCGDQLPTSMAKQCLSCGMDWHDPQSPRRLGGG